MALLTQKINSFRQIFMKVEGVQFLGFWCKALFSIICNFFPDASNKISLEMFSIDLFYQFSEGHNNFLEKSKFHPNFLKAKVYLTFLIWTLLISLEIESCDVFLYDLQYSKWNFNSSLSNRTISNQMPR